MQCFPHAVMCLYRIINITRFSGLWLWLLSRNSTGSMVMCQSEHTKFGHGRLLCNFAKAKSPKWPHEFKHTKIGNARILIFFDVATEIVLFWCVPRFELLVLSSPHDLF